MHNPEYLFKKYTSQIKKTPCPKPFQTPTKLPTWSMFGVVAHQQVFLPPMARTHANALATEAAQNGMAQWHHLSKALVVSLRKNNDFNKGFCQGRRKTLRSGGFFNFWYEFNKGCYFNIFPGYLLVLKLFPGVCTKSALQASQSAGPARKSAFHM